MHGNGQLCSWSEYRSGNGLRAWALDIRQPFCFRAIRSDFRNRYRIVSRPPTRVCASHKCRLISSGCPALAPVHINLGPFVNLAPFATGFSIPIPIRKELNAHLLDEPAETSIVPGTRKCFDGSTLFSQSIPSPAHWTTFIGMMQSSFLFFS